MNKTQILFIAFLTLFFTLVNLGITRLRQGNIREQFVVNLAKPGEIVNTQIPLLNQMGETIGEIEFASSGQTLSITARANLTRPPIGSYYQLIGTVAYQHVVLGGLEEANGGKFYFTHIYNQPITFDSYRIEQKYSDSATSLVLAVSKSGL